MTPTSPEKSALIIRRTWQGFLNVHTRDCWQREGGCQCTSLICSHKYDQLNKHMPGFERYLTTCPKWFLQCEFWWNQIKDPSNPAVANYRPQKVYKQNLKLLAFPWSASWEKKTCMFGTYIHPPTRLWLRKEEKVYLALVFSVLLEMVSHQGMQKNYPEGIKRRY